MGLTSGYVQVSDAGSDEPSGGPRLKSAKGTKSLSSTSLERSIAGCCLYDALLRKSDMERHGVCPGSSLKTLGHEETGLRI